MQADTEKNSNREEQGRSALTGEQRQALATAKRPINIANGFRVFFAVSSLLVLIIIYLVSKFGADATWFPKVNQLLFEVLTWDILFMVISTIVKIVFVAKYNKIVKKL